MQEPFKYPGNELALFHHAVHWKKYFTQNIRPYIRGHVLEAGAGMGSSTLLLNDGSAQHWLLLEPDLEMSSLLQQKISKKELPANSEVITGTLDNIRGKFDTILYIDVLEHIVGDAAEMSKAASLLNPGGHIIVLSPAFQFLYSPFDKVIGHYRRYDKRMIRRVTPPGLKLLSNRYYDSMGFFASLVNKLMLRQQYPTLSQIHFWDKWLIPVSRVLDKLFLHAFGKSIIAIWEKPHV